MKALSLTIQKICPMFKFFEKWVKLQGHSHKVKNFDINRKVLPMKYENLISYYSKDMANVKVFEKWVKLQGQGHYIKNFGINRKTLS
jgi:hypothetical protein